MSLVVITYWSLVGVYGLGFVVFMGVDITKKVFHVHGPSGSRIAMRTRPGQKRKIYNYLVATHILLVTGVLIMFTGVVRSRNIVPVTAPKHYRYVIYAPQVARIDSNAVYQAVTGGVVSFTFTAYTAQGLPAGDEPVSFYVKPNNGQWISSLNKLARRYVFSSSSLTNMRGQAEIRVRKVPGNPSTAIRVVIHNLSNRASMSGVEARWTRTRSPRKVSQISVNPIVQVVHPGQNPQIIVRALSAGHADVGLTTRIGNVARRTNAKGTVVFPRPFRNPTRQVHTVTIGNYQFDLEVVDNQPQVFERAYRLTPHPRYHVSG